MRDRLELGRCGEDAAASYLVECGMVVVRRNWRCRHGEIDIVAREGETLVFCEVKTRRGSGFGTPLDAITPRKCARLRRLVGAYLAQADGPAGLIRIDAIGILWGAEGPLTLEHVIGVA